MKTNKIIDSVEWTLTEEAKNDKSLNPIDLNVLAELDDMLDIDRCKDADGFTPFLISSSNKKTDTLVDSLKSDGCEVDRRTVERSIKKLDYLGYISFRRGDFTHAKDGNVYPSFRILKGSRFILVNNRVTNNETDDCGVIAQDSDKPVVNTQNNTFGSDCVSDNCSVIAHIHTYIPEYVTKGMDVYIDASADSDAFVASVGSQVSVDDNMVGETKETNNTTAAPDAFVASGGSKENVKYDNIPEVCLGETPDTLTGRMELIGHTESQRNAVMTARLAVIGKRLGWRRPEETETDSSKVYAMFRSAFTQESAERWTNLYSKEIGVDGRKRIALGMRLTQWQTLKCELDWMSGVAEGTAEYNPYRSKCASSSISSACWSTWDARHKYTSEELKMVKDWLNDAADISKNTTIPKQAV